MRLERRLMLVSAGAALAVACAMSVALLGCRAPLPTEPAGITGSVVRAVPGDGRPASISVESTGAQPPGSISDKASVNIPPNTMFFAADGSAASLEAIAGIRAGTRVRVWFQGAVAESYPVQGSAKAVQILGK